MDVKWAVERISTCSKNLKTVFYKLCEADRIKLIKDAQLLLDAGITGQDFLRFLYSACLFGRYKMVTLMMKYDLESHYVYEKNYPFFSLLKKAVVEELSNADLGEAMWNYCKRYENDVLINCEELIPLADLIQNGDDIDKTRSYGGTIFRSQATIFMSHCDSLGIPKAVSLVKHGANLEIKNIDGRTGLMFACWNGLDALVKLLIERGIDINVKDNYGGTAFIYACQRGERGVHPECFILLVKQWAKLHAENHSDTFGDRQADFVEFVSKLCDCDDNEGGYFVDSHEQDNDFRMELQNKIIDYSSSGFGRFSNPYIEVIKGDCLEMLKLLLKLGICMDKDYDSAATYKYIWEHSDRNEHIEIFQWLNKQYAIDQVSAGVRNLNNIFRDICQANTIEGAEILLKAGLKNQDFLGALYTACIYDCPEIVRLLVNYEPHACQVDKSIYPFFTVLNKAVDNNCDGDFDGEMANYIMHYENDILMNSGFLIPPTDVKKRDDIDIDESLDYGGTTVVSQCRSYFVPKAISLIKHGADLEESDSVGRTALMIACGNSLEVVVKMLIERGVDVTKTDSYGDSAFIYACQKGSRGLNPRCFVMLVKQLAKLYARKHNREDIVEFVDILCDDKDKYDDSFIDPPQYAQEFMKELRVTVDSYSVFKNPFNRSVVAGCLDLVKLFVRIGAKCETSLPPLSLACIYNQADVAEWILDQRLFSPDVETAFQEACKHGSSECVSLLLEKYEININLQDVSGKTCLMKAVRSNRHDLIQVLLSKGADLDVADQNGYTAFSFAMEQACDKCIEILFLTGKLMSRNQLKLIHSAWCHLKRIDQFKIAVKYNFFEWHMCEKELLSSVIGEAIQKGICPGGVMDKDDRYTSPIIEAFKNVDSHYLSDFDFDSDNSYDDSKSDKEEIKSVLDPIQLAIQYVFFHPEDITQLKKLRQTNVLRHAPQMLDYITAQPLSLKVLAFLVLSKAISNEGTPCDRKLRVDTLSIPNFLKMCLNFEIPINKCF